MKIKKAHIHKSAGIIIKDRKLLVTREYGKDYFVSPGGSLEKNENPAETLIRELFEEVSIKVKHEHLENFGIFYAEAANDSGKIVKMNVFRVTDWEGEITPSMDIEEIKWLTSEILADLNVGSIFQHEIIPRLKELNLKD